MRRSLLSTLLILLIGIQVSAYKKESIDITVNGKQRNMIVFTPSMLPAKSPLFIVTHGMDQSPEYQYDSDKMYEMIDTAKFVIAYLRSDGNTWDTGGTKDQNFVIQTIEEMAKRFDIDKERVYWSGFSMGSMLIHHCIANMQDKIAAFAPTSGIQFSESPWNNCKKPVYMLECIAYDDDVFGYEQYGIHAYIENYAKHNKYASYSRTTDYKPISSSWYNGDLEKWTGGAKGGEVWLYSYRNGGHWPMNLNRHLIWNFCKRFSLNMPSVGITTPVNGITHLCMAPKGEAVFPDITIEATAQAINGNNIEKVDFYDGETLIESLEASPYTTTLTTPTSGEHNLYVEATDNKGKTAQTSCLVNYIESATSHRMYSTFKIEGTVPQGWYVNSGSTKRIGGGLSYTSGSRILHFKSSAFFEYGLLVKSTTSKEKGAWAKFGDANAHSRLTLHAGHYAIKYTMCNWNQPEFSPVTLAVENLNGEEVASEIYTPTINIGGNTDNTFKRVSLHSFEFDVPETGDYVIAFYTNAAINADFVLGQFTIQAMSFLSTGISDVNKDKTQSFSRAYDLNGNLVNKDNLSPGIYIIDGQKVWVK